MTYAPDDDECGRYATLREPPPEIAATLSVLDGKWKMLILWQLFRRTCRFNELRRAIPGVSQHMLTVQLRDLESEGIITRTVFPEVPPRVEYALTPHGQTLGPVIHALLKWGETHLSRSQGDISKPIDAAGGVGATAEKLAG